ncbi:MAG TPA: RNA 2',3'-cyclic phosphodiesterase [Gemmatimonadota bacterium]|nr:RNA 2',3'-cyclic phosphodiesterase [Gemmatimonadota bacterium]
MKLPDTPVRSFVALPCPPGLREAIAAARPAWRAAGEGVRWARPEQLHLTLRFLGPAGPLRLPALDEGLAAAAAVAPPVRLRPAGPGAFPGWRRPRVLWLGLDGGPALDALAGAVEGAARVAGFPEESRPFQPHLTLGRVSDLRAARRCVAVVREWRPDAGTEEVSEIVLYRSDLEPGGARHSALARYRLGGSA